MRNALVRHDTVLRTAIERSGGQVVKTTGDGMMAVFSAAPDAVSATLTAQRDLAAGPWPETGPLRVRMGIHAGQADQRAGDYFGPAVNRTARIMAAGHGGQVLLSGSAMAETKDRLPPSASLRDLGEHRLKDLGRPEHVFQLVHPDLASTFPPRRRSARRPAATRTTELVAVKLSSRSQGLISTTGQLLTLTGPAAPARRRRSVLPKTSRLHSPTVSHSWTSPDRATRTLSGGVARPSG
jgi:hypothetical protein